MSNIWIPVCKIYFWSGCFQFDGNVCDEKNFNLKFLFVRRENVSEDSILDCQNDAELSSSSRQHHPHKLISNYQSYCLVFPVALLVKNHTILLLITPIFIKVETHNKNGY